MSSKHPSSPSSLPSPDQHLRAFRAEHPGRLELAKIVRETRDAAGVTWPGRCFVPFDLLEATLHIRHGYLLERPDAETKATLSAEALLAAGLAAWSMTKGIFRFDPDVLEELFTTALKGDIPAAVLQRLPHWCVYVELPELSLNGYTVRGAFAWMDVNYESGDDTLAINWDVGDDLVPCLVPLGGSLEDGIRLVTERARASLERDGSTETAAALVADEMVRHVYGSHELISGLINLLLYLASDEPEYDADEAPRKPQPKKTKKGRKLFQANGSRTWGVGSRLGAKLRKARRQTVGAHGNGTHASPRGHIRAAHWHRYWIGPLDGPREIRVHWIPPLPVNLDEDDHPTVYRKVA